MKENKKKKKRRTHPFIRGFVGCIAVVLLVVCGASFVMAGALHGKLNYSEIEEVKREPFKEAGVKNILLIGNDSRSADESGRSDAMILVSVSSKTNSIHLTSLLRDIYVEIPGHEGNRLNAAYAYGGPELLMETLEKNFDIEVNRYMLVNFQAFANLVDAVGGVDLELSNEEVQYVNGYLVEYNQLEGRPEGTDYLDTSLSGTIHLNGPQALAYCRNRYIGTDFARTERQRKVISAAMKNAPLALVTNGSELIEVQYVNGYLVEYNQLEGRPEGTDYLDTSLSGTIHLNGPQALAYCRNRYIGTDFARTERQRKVISAAMKNAPLALVTNGSELIEGVMSNITTNLTKTELSGLMIQAPMMLTYETISGSIPLEGTYSNANIRGMAVLEVDFEANKQYIQKEIYGK